MVEDKLKQAVAIKRDIEFAEEDVRMMKRLRDYMLEHHELKDEKYAIEKAWEEFHMFSFTNCWANALRAKFIKAIFETIDERLAQLDKELLELNQEFDKL